MKRSLSVFVVPVVLGLLAGGAIAGPSVLVDEVHGQPCRDTLVDLWPDCQIDVLTAADFPIENVLASGVLAPQDTTFTVTVPPGAAMLYGRFDCPENMTQFPFISVYDSGGGLVAHQFRGGFHVEDPDPGVYVVEYSIWTDDPLPFTIGTGPNFFTVSRLASYDVVFRLHDNMFMLFDGELPEYTSGDEAVLQAHASQGGGNLLVRDPLRDIAMKPIIDLVSPVDQVCDVTVVIPGDLTYSEPAARETRWSGGATAIWSDVAVDAGSVTRLLYEVGLSPSQPRLEVSFTGGTTRVRNHTVEPLRELVLVRKRTSGEWELATAGDVPADSEMAVSCGRPVSRADAAAILRRTLFAGGLSAGLSTVQMTEFQGCYRWTDRILDETDGSSGWTAIYRVDATACDRLLPLVTEPAATTRVRTLWYWVGGIPADSAWRDDWPAPSATPGPAATCQTASSLALYEYGVVHQHYPTFSAVPTTKELDWLGWSFHDGGAVVDPTDNNGDPYEPYFDTPGGHSDALDLLAGLPWIEGVMTGAVAAPYAEQLLTGDVDAYTDDDMFPPGSFPAVAVAKSIGLGRAAAIHDTAIMTAWWPYNQTYLRRVLDWVTGPTTEIPPDETPPAKVSSLSAQPNPFNPRVEVAFELTTTGRVQVDVFDAAGRRVARLHEGPLAAGEQRLFWDGCTDHEQRLAAGVYMARVTTVAGSWVCKMMLVD